MEAQLKEEVDALKAQITQLQCKLGERDLANVEFVAERRALRFKIDALTYELRKMKEERRSQSRLIGDLRAEKEACVRRLNAQIKTLKQEIAKKEKSFKDILEEQEEDKKTFHHAADKVVAILAGKEEIVLTETLESGKDNACNPKAMLQ